LKVKLYACGGERDRYVSEIPLGIGYLLTNVLRADVSFVRRPEELKGAEIVGLSSTAWGAREAVDIAKKFHGGGVITVLGGQGALWSGFSDPRAHGFDFVVRGDGETALQDIIDGYAEPGVIDARRVECLDDLEFPERGECAVSVPITTSRGCPFKCAFCSSRAQWGRRPRLRSPANIMSEIEMIAERYASARELYLYDDLFAYPPRRFNELYEMWMAGDWNRRFRLRGFIRSNMASRSLFTKMKRMGFLRVRFGAESGSDRMLRVLRKGATVADHQRAVDLAADAGLRISASFMHGLPGETERDRQATNHFIARNRDKLSVEGRYEFKAFPGTDLWDGASPLDADMRVRPS
jgi:radical SAM superfamily enzyme YgiQ (UPF0313 family)